MAKKGKKKGKMKLPSLSLWKAAKERAEEEGPGFEEFPDGRYVFKITGAERAVSANDRPQINWELTFSDGEFEGKTYRDYQGLETEDNLVYVVQRLGRLGYEAPDSPDDLDDTLKKIVTEELEVRGRLKSKGEFQNLWIDALVDDEEEGEGEENGENDEEEGGDDDDDEIEVGSTVTLESEKNETEYEVTEIEGETVSIKDDEDEVYECTISDCVLVESEEEEEEEKGVEVGVGDRVAAKNKKGEMVEGEIKRISRDKTKVSIEDEDGTVHRGIPVENVMGEPPEKPKKTPKGKKEKTKVKKKKGGKQKK